MNYRVAVLHEKETITADKTFYIDIGGAGPISVIQIQAKGTNGSGTPTAHPAKFLTSIQLVDGSEVVMDLTGIQAQALDYYHTRKTPFNLLSWYDNQVCAAIFNLHFGRFLYDPEMALDPKRFKNLQLKITYDENGGGSACDAGQLEVLAHVFNDKMINPLGYFKAWQVYDYTLVQSGYETFDLPVDNPIRKIMISSLAAGYEPYVQYNKVRIQADNGADTFVDDSVSDLLKNLALEYGPLVEGHEGIGTTSPVTHFCTPTYLESIVATNRAGTPAAISVDKGYGGSFAVDQETGGSQWYGIVMGYAPHGAMILNTGRDDVIEDWMDTRAIKKLEARIQAGSGAVGTCDTVVQQMIRY